MESKKVRQSEPRRDEEVERLLGLLKIEIMNQAFRGPLAQTFAETTVRISGGHAYYFNESRQIIKVTIDESGGFVHEVQNIQ